MSQFGRIVVVGSGGREHALVEALLRSPSQPRVEAAPGNPGMPEQVHRHPVEIHDIDRLIDVCVGADLVVVGPEAPLVAGLADRLRSAGTLVLGPSAAAAELEGSKTFAKTIMTRALVPTATWAPFDEPEGAKAFVRQLPSAGAVIKADGLAAGKGVIVALDDAGADAAIDRLFTSYDKVVVEERLEGEELSVLALSDGARLRVFPPAQDHKRLEDGDRGPNTGGMGAYAPAPLGTPKTVDEIVRTCMEPVVAALAEEGTPLVGVLYAGIMMTTAGPRVLEYNVRFGDPEAQCILPLVDEDLAQSFVAAARGSLKPGRVAVRPGAAVTVVLASAGYPATSSKGDVIHGTAEAENLGVSVFHAGTALRGSECITNGGRVLGLTGLGPDLLTAAESAYRGVAQVCFHGMQFRKDIAARALGRPLG